MTPGELLFCFRPALVLGPLAQQPGRTAVAVLAIAVGVALGLAVHLVNAAAVGEFARAARHLAGAADIVVKGSRSGFDEGLYPLLARHPGIEVASPMLEVEARLDGRDDTLRILGIDLFRAALVQPGLLAAADDRLDALRPDALFVSRSTLAALGRAVGDRIGVQVGMEVRPVRIAGLLAADVPGARFAVMDLGAAQTLFAREGRLSRIDLKLGEGTERDRLMAGLPLPPGVDASPVDESGEGAARMTRAYRVNLDVLALVALFTGGLLVFSTQALSVARRRSQIAFLRVLGATRLQVATLIVGEGAVLGLAGAVAGTAAGIGLARAALAFSGGDLGAGFFAGTGATLRLDSGSLPTFAGLGIAASVLGSLAPAVEATRAVPALALRSGDDMRAFPGLASPWPGLACLLGAGGAVTLPPVDGLPLFGYAAIALLLFGAILLLPRALTLLLRVLPESRSVAATLGIARLRAYPARAAVSLSAIVAAVSLMVAMAIMVASFRDSLQAWLAGMLPADLYFRSAARGESGFLSPDHQDRIRALPGVGRVEFLRWQQVASRDGPPALTLLARDGVDGDADRRLPLVTPAMPGRGMPPDAWVSESAAAIHGWAPGRDIALSLGGEWRTFRVAGVWRDYARQTGAVLIDRVRYVSLTGDRLANDAGLWVTGPERLPEVRAALESLAPAGGELMTPGDVRELSLAAFDRTFALTYALEAVAIAIGLLGLSSAIGGEVIARRREFGVLRHLGVARRDIARVLAAEGAAIGAAGLAVGGGVGFAMSLVLIHVVNRQSFHWGMELHVPWAGLAAFFGTMLALATATAVLAGREAMGADPVRAVREDW